MKKGIVKILKFYGIAKLQVLKSVFHNSNIACIRPHSCKLLLWIPYNISFSFKNAEDSKRCMV